MRACSCHFGSVIRAQRVNGPAIRAIRERGGQRQLDLASGAGIDRAYLAHIEAGRRQPSAPVARRLAEALKVPLIAILASPDDTT